MAVTLSVIVATSGRPTLTRALQSLTPQLAHGDEVLILRRDRTPYGNASRDQAVTQARGTHLWTLDDDDQVVDGALNVIRGRVGQQPAAAHIFKMRYGPGYPIYTDTTLWDDATVRFGNIGGAMFVVPNVPGKMGTWVHSQLAGGDYHFLSGTLELQGCDTVFHEDVVQVIRP